MGCLDDFGDFSIQVMLFVHSFDDNLVISDNLVFLFFLLVKNNGEGKMKRIDKKKEDKIV